MGTQVSWMMSWILMAGLQFPVGESLFTKVRQRNEQDDKSLFGSQSSLEETGKEIQQLAKKLC